MKKGIAILLSMLAISIVISSTGYAANYFTVFQWVRNPDGSSGEATSINAYGKGVYFRYSTSDTAQSSTTSEYHLPSSPNAAYVLRDVGTGWGTNPTPGERIFGIVQVPGGLRTPYSYGLNYVGASSVVYVSGQSVILPTVHVQAVPTPEMKSRSTSSIVISWEGMTTFEAGGTLVNSVETYAVYRSTQEAGTYSYIGSATHVSGEVTYSDSGLSPLTTYWYKLRLRYAWAGNSPPYYETFAESRPRGITTSSLAPSITSIEALSVQNSGSQKIKIYGQRLSGATNVSLTREGSSNIEDNSPENISDSQVTATFNFNPALHTIGTWDVWVTATAGTGYSTSSQSRLTLTAEAPYITSVEPQSAGTNATVSGFKVYGSRLYPGSTVRITRGSATFTASSVTTNSGYSLLTCSPITLTNATIGTWDVTVTSMFGQVTRESLFLVTSESPTISTITPTRGATGTTVSVTSLAGTNLFDDSVVELRKTGYSTIIATGVSANVGHTSLAFSVNLTGATTGAWSVFVKNSDEKAATSEGLFTVTSPPVLYSITPATAENNSSVSVNIRGVNFFSTPEVSLSRSGMTTIDATAEILVSSTEITCTLPITNASIGTWDVVAVNGDGTGILSNGFTITSEAPTFTSITPNSGAGGYTIPVTIAGNRFYTGATVEVRKTGRDTIIGASVSVTDINTITCDLTLPNGALDVGTWDVYIGNTDGKSTIESGAFTLTYGTVEAPSDCAITALTTTSVSITWTDNSLNEERFRIQRSEDGSAYTNVGTAAAGATSYTGDGTTGLSVNTRYWFRVRAEGGGQESAYSTASPKYTLVAAPSAEAFSDSTSTVITANWSAGLNPSGTLYYCQNQSNSNNSGNISALTWQNTGLLPDTSYTYRVRAVNGDGVAGDWTSLGSDVTKEKRSVYYFAVDGIKLLSGDILGATSNISVVFSSESGINMGSFRLYIDGTEVTDGTNIYYDSYSTDGIFTTVNYKIKTALSEGTYTIMASATDPSGILYEDERTNLQVMAAGTKTVVGYVLPYPNPFDPTAGSVKLTYRLSTDTNVTIYIFDVNGRLAWKENYQSGFNGGKAGYNEVLWNGFDVFNRILDNDVYLIRIVESGTGKVMGKGKVVILKSVSSNPKNDNDQKIAAAPVSSDNDYWNGLKGQGASGAARILLLSLVGLIAFEELARMYFSIKKIGGQKR